VTDFAFLVQVLSEIYDDAEIAKWLWKRDRAWGERYRGWKRYLHLFSNGGLPSWDSYMGPLDLIAAGRTQEVIDVAMAEVDRAKRPVG
jgi:hypothetical protein